MSKNKKEEERIRKELKKLKDYTPLLHSPRTSFTVIEHKVHVIDRTKAFVHDREREKRKDFI